MAERPWAILAEFDTPERLVEAACALRDQGFDRLDAFTPFPVPELEQVLGWRDRRVPAAMLIGGIAGALAGIAMQVATNLDYPLWIGGRPLLAWPAFALIAFELMVLGAVVAGVVTFFVTSRLPKLHHPVFDAERFDLGAGDRFFLAVLPDARRGRAAIGKALAKLDPAAITEVAA